jgi:hypothetical protein
MTDRCLCAFVLGCNLVSKKNTHKKRKDARSRENVENAAEQIYALCVKDTHHSVCACACAHARVRASETDIATISVCACARVRACMRLCARACA